MKYSWVAAIALITLSACEEEVSGPVSTETGGEAAGEVLGGTISDEMIPLEELTSTSPPAERTTTTSVTRSEGETQTTVQTTVTASSDPEAPQPAPPEPPTTPDEGEQY